LVLTSSWRVDFTDISALHTVTTSLEDIRRCLNQVPLPETHSRNLTKEDRYSLRTSIPTWLPGKWVAYICMYCLRSRKEMWLHSGMEDWWCRITYIQKTKHDKPFIQYYHSL
jgi:hypothetical protein